MSLLRGGTRRALGCFAAAATLAAGLAVPVAAQATEPGNKQQARREKVQPAKGQVVTGADGQSAFDAAMKQWQASRANGKTALAEQATRSRLDEAAQIERSRDDKGPDSRSEGANLADTDPGPGGTMGRPGGGDYKATSLSPSSSWTAGGSSGSFTWSYPFRAVPAAAGPTPQLSISYDSGSVDGRTAATNNQTSAIGEGFDLTTSYIERSYGSCHEDGNAKKHDLCWRGEHLTLVLNGQANQLIRVSSNEFKLKSDDGSTIKRLPGATNGAKYGEHWQLIAADGTTYTFGLNRLPGWSTGKSETESTWTVPVYTDDANDPGNPFDATGNETCHKAEFVDSLCTQAWRWNLDLVTDLDGNAASYWYAKETNHYAKGGKETAPTEYDRGGYLKRIEYGQRSGNLYEAGPQQVRFETAERCLAETCGTLDAGSQAKWPDVPFDSLCTAEQIRNADTTYPFDDPKCATVAAPTFFTRRLLKEVTTGLATTSGFREVDRWTLLHDWFDPGDVGDTTDQVLWLSSIQHSGRVGDPITTRPTRLAWTDGMANRVDRTGDGMASLDRPRLGTIISETGATTQVGYARTECTAGTHPVTPDGGNVVKAAAENDKRCFPTYWAPYGGNPKVDWFHKYVVDTVRDKDTTTGDAVTTTYQYLNGGAWRYDENPTVADDYRTWSQWRGYQEVSTLVGDPDAPDRSKSTATFFRGMDGNRSAGGATLDKKVSGITSAAPAVPDKDEFAGMAYESVLYNGRTKAGTTGDPVSSTVNVAWSKQTASMTHSGGKLDLPDTEDDKDISAVTVRAVLVRPEKVINQTYVTSGAWPYWKQAVHEVASRAPSGHPSAIDSWTIEESAGQRKNKTCTQLSYVSNPELGIVGLPSRNKVLSVSCADTPVFPTDTNKPGDVISDQLMRYQGATSWSGKPTGSHVIMTGRAQSYSATGTTNIQVTSTTSYDALGRPRIVADANDAKTETTYTPAGAGIPASVAVKNALGHVTTTNLEPAWLVPTKVTDPNTRIVETTYDALGRAKEVWTPLGHRDYGAQPDYKFTYHLGGSGQVGEPVDGSWIRTSRYVGFGDTYIDSYENFDALLRPRQTQAPAVGRGRILTDTNYDDRGQVYQSFTGAYEPTHEPTGSRWRVAEGSAVQTSTAFDGANRPTDVKTTYLAAVEQNGTTLRSRSTRTSYFGDTTATEPPAGGVGSRVITDALGRVVERRQYPTADPTGTGFEATTFEYNPQGRQSAVVGPVGTAARWTYEYDLRGRQIKTTDPDRGATLTAYDELDRVLSTDGKGMTGALTNKRLSYTYDVLGRKTGMYSGLDPAVGATKLARWTYDSAAKGYLASSTRISAGREYTKSITEYGRLYQPAKSSISIDPTDPLVTEAKLPATYAYETDYQADGSVYSTTEPAAGGLPKEVIGFNYDDEHLGLVDEILGGPSSIVTDTTYTPFGDLSSVDLANSRSSLIKAQLFYEYDGLRRMTRYDAVTSEPAAHVTDQFYAYNDVDQVTSITDRAPENAAIPGSGKDNQCFTYGAQQRLKEAWTPDPSSTIVSDQPNVDPVADCSSAHKATDKLGGPGAYWHEFAYRKGGARSSWTQHATPSDSEATETTYGYGGTCPGTSRGPHTLAYVQVDEAKRDMCSDPQGNVTLSHTEDGTRRDAVWNSEGRLSALRVGAEGDEGYAYYSNLYDADGNLLIKRPANAKDGRTTIYLGSTEVVVTQATTGTTKSFTTEGRRYYSHPAGTVAVRTAKPGAGTVLSFLTADPHGTSSATIRASTMAATKRYTDPFGNSRGGVESWVDDKGFLGKPSDPDTEITHIGAREYDPQTGRFLSLDPIMDTADGQSLNGYTYSNSDPVNKTDPTGLMLLDSPGGGTGYVPPPPKPDPPKRSLREKLAGEVVLGVTAEVAGGADVVLNAGIDGLEKRVPELEKANLNSNLEGGVTSLAEKAGYDTTGFWSAFTGGRIASYFIPGIGTARAIVKIPTVARVVEKVVEKAKKLVRRKSDEAADNVPSAAAGNTAAKACSFVGTTTVLMADGSHTSIEDVKVGDEVIATDPETGEQVARKVEHLFVHEDTVVDLVVDGEVITTTENHPFWSVTDQRFERADDLSRGEKVLGVNGRVIAVSGLRLKTARHALAYNLSVQGIHTYHVGNSEILVHNDCEEVLPTYDHFEQARNRALELLGDVDPGTRQPYVGRLETSTTTYGKTVGFTTRVDGVFKRFRMDYDLTKGPHINVEIGRGASVKKWAVPWKGTEEDFARLLGGNS